jgi:hypothetical protein
MPVMGSVIMTGTHLNRPEEDVDDETPEEKGHIERLKGRYWSQMENLLAESFATHNISRHNSLCSQ